MSTLELEDYYRMKFDYAVEDSPKAFRFFEHLPELKVLVFDRPWNRECAFPRICYYESRSGAASIYERKNSRKSDRL